MTRYEIRPEQIEACTERGFVLLPGALPASLLARFRDVTARMEADALAAHARSERLHGACVIEDPVGPRLMRYDDVLGVDPDAVLDLLACPTMIAVARELCGRGAVPLQSDVVYKHAHPHPVIAWHQGAPHPRGYPYLNVGIYLDDAHAGDGCVRYVPGTQHELQDIPTLAQAHGWDIPGVIEQPARAGDILIQDMMILHGSPPKRVPGVRRTIYVEFRPLAGIEESAAQSAHWARLRARWMALVLRRAAPAGWPEPWRADLPTDLGSDEAEAGAILEHREPPIPAVYGVQRGGPDYPIPADLRDTVASVDPTG